MTTIFRVERPVFQDATIIYARVDDDSGRHALVADGLKLVTVKEGLMWPPLLEIPEMSNWAQNLFQAMWEAGFRPTSGEAGTAHIEALKYHLEDMRRLVLPKL